MVSVEWRLRSLDGRVSERGEASGIADGGGFSNDEADRPFIAFSASRGQQYRLAIRTLEDARPLAFAHPRIVVQPTGMTNEDEIVKKLGDWALAGLTGIAGAILLVCGYIGAEAGRPSEPSCSWVGAWNHAAMPANRMFQPSS